MDKVADQNDKIAALLSAHGLSVSYYKEWVLANENLPGFSANIVREFEYENSYSVQLDVRIALDAKTVIVESFAGVGENRDDATGDAIANFTLTGLHPLLAAFYGIDEDQVKIEKWEVAGKAWQAIIGDYGVRGPQGAAIEAPKEVLSTLEGLIKQRRLNGKVHWLRLYYGHVDAQNITCEVLLDNEPWEAAQDEIKRLAGPGLSEFYSIRLFLILRIMES